MVKLGMVKVVNEKRETRASFFLLYPANFFLHFLCPLPLFLLLFTLSFSLSYQFIGDGRCNGEARDGEGCERETRNVSFLLPPLPSQLFSSLLVPLASFSPHLHSLIFSFISIHFPRAHHIQFSISLPCANCISFSPSLPCANHIHKSFPFLACHVASKTLHS